ncbi:MAG: hypothetical protein KME46_11180 [Brasilonema angustatum HA4187-MV1]|jgi:hypothetical protein|nr:hypothetical protein [Brasilonema angustatum HA4187-MV1]
MSKQSLEKFLNEEFLHQGATQEKLKATDSFDNFVNLMVSLGNINYSFTEEEVKAFLLDKINENKKTKQDKADRAKAEIEAMNAPLEVKIEAKEKAQEIAEQEKKQIDDNWAKGVANWNYQFVESGIGYLTKGSLPIYP